MKAIFLVVVFLVTPFDADCMQAAESEILGTWQAVSIQDGGRTAPDEYARGVRWIVTETQIRQEDEEGATEWTFTLDESQSPAWIDLDERGDVSKGIYKIEGDVFTVCFPEGGFTERSTAFESKPASPNDILIVFRRR